jgi:molybdopterin-containing oxidoreductase family iron-sulfur binding subunit
MSNNTSSIDNNKNMAGNTYKSPVMKEYFESRGEVAPTEQKLAEFLSDDKLKESSTERRDFLKFLGFSVAAATLAACEAPVIKAIPYVNKPENVTPGEATWYASAYYDGNAYANILVKTREGRPIFIKGNRDYGMMKGAVNAEMIASVLSLYDSERLKNPLLSKADTDWSKLDTAVVKSLNDIKAKNGKIVILANSIISPSTLMAIEEFKKAFSTDATAAVGNVELIQYDAISYNGIRKANETSFGLNVIPDYDFSKAETIVSVGADFLNGWLTSNLFSVQYAAGRNPKEGKMSTHYQFEANLSITGSNADYRGMVKPSQYVAVLAAIAEGVGAGSVAGVDTSAVKSIPQLAKAIQSLRNSKGKSLLVCGSNDVALQTITNKINHVLGNYTTTINLNNPLNMFKSEDAKVEQLVKDVVAGTAPDALFFYGTNPVYTLPNGAEFAKALSKVSLTVSFAQWEDETASLCKFVATDHHALEAWNDYNPIKNEYAIAQPTIRPLHNTAAAQESFLVWANLAQRGGKNSKVFFNYIQKTWEQYGFPMQTQYKDFFTYWNKSVHDSVLTEPIVVASEPAFVGTLSGLTLPKVTGSGDFEVELYTKSSMGIGMQAGNPWLQEMPDPMTKITWDNYVTMNLKDAEAAGYNRKMDQEHGASIVTVKAGNTTFTLPVIPTPGQTKGTIGIALGYGRGENGERIGKAAFKTKEYGGYETNGANLRANIGENGFKLTAFVAGTLVYGSKISVTKAEGIYPIAMTQTQRTAMGRNSIAKETTLSIFNKKPKQAYNPPHLIESVDGPKSVNEITLWNEHPVENVGHRWGMSVDLNSCLGCGACLIACQSENNVPVVGKDEVRRGREMHWLRLDRYFKSENEVAIGLNKEGVEDKYLEDNIEENPTVFFMPMMCQHCNHAPCETVCPVAATTHSDEGLNQMVYNRCIGTRYCANNCPYKVRRFNWFNYPSYKKFTEVNPSQDDLGRMVLNPDVVVRTRGVMEKCSMCVQKIQAGKLTAKKESRPVKDGDVMTACQEVCPTNAITIGDWNDPESEIRKLSKDKRAYQALEEIGVKPNIWYQLKVRNAENPELDKMQVLEEAVEHFMHRGHNKKAH